MATAHVIRLDDVRNGKAIVEQAGAPAPVEIRPDHIRLVAPISNGHGRRGVGVLGFVVSLLIHVAAGGAYVWAPTLQAIGGGGQELESISIEIVSASALESDSSAAVAADGGASQPVHSKTGDGMAVDQAEVAAVTPDRVVAPPPDKPVAQLELPPTPAEEFEYRSAERVEEKPPDLPPPEQFPEMEVAKDPAPTAEVREAQQAMSAGGITAEARVEVAQQAGAAGASAGEVAQFAIAVRRAVGRARPPHAGSKGRVTITFGLTEDGTIRFSHIAKSSGSRRLDEAALVALNGTTFPAPPAGMTDIQRTYTVPYEFR